MGKLRIGEGGFESLYLPKDSISVNVGQSFRGKKNSKRPPKIAIIFTRETLEGIYKTPKSYLKFEQWLKNAVYPALKEI